MEHASFSGLGTLMRHVLDVMDGDVARVYTDLGIEGYRPKFSPVIRAITALGPLSIRDIARATGVTHSAASQTVAHMTRAGLLELAPGADARQRVAALTARARDLLPVIEAEWAATTAAAAEMEAELPAPLTDVLIAAERAVVSRPMHTRIRDAARVLYESGSSAPAPDSTASRTPAASRLPSASRTPAASRPPAASRNSAAYLSALRAIAGEAS